MLNINNKIKENNYKSHVILFYKTCHFSLEINVRNTDI